MYVLFGFSLFNAETGVIVEFPTDSTTGVIVDTDFWTGVIVESRIDSETGVIVGFPNDSWTGVIVESRIVSGTGVIVEFPTDSWTGFTRLLPTFPGILNFCFPLRR